MCFFHSFTQQIYIEPKTVLGCVVTAVNKEHKSLCPHGAYILVRADGPQAKQVSKITIISNKL